MNNQKNHSRYGMNHMRHVLASGFCRLKGHPLATAAAGLVLVSLVMLFAVTAALSPVVVDDNGRQHTILTLGRTPKTILMGAGITLAEDDVVTASLDGPEKRICIERAFDVSITVDNGNTTIVRMTGGTVNDALERAGVSLNESEVTNVSGSDQLTDGLNICVEKREYEERLVTEEVPYVTTVQYTANQPAGSRRTVQAGAAGLKTYRYRDYVENGVVVSTELVSEELTVQPVNAVVMAGSGALSPAPEELLLDENGAPLKYKKVLEGTACAYTARPGAVTSTGATPKVGTVAVNPKLIPYGSKLFIVSEDGYVYGYGVAQDTGGGVLKNKILADLYMDTTKECFAFGRRRIKLYILE